MIWPMDSKLVRLKSSTAFGPPRAVCFDVKSNVSAYRLVEKMLAFKRMNS